MTSILGLLEKILRNELQFNYLRNKKLLLDFFLQFWNPD